MTRDMDSRGERRRCLHLFRKEPMAGPARTGDGVVMLAGAEPRVAFDPMAAAVDWLDAYRAGDVEAIVQMYADGAVTECACDGVTIVGRESLRSYWKRRLKEYPASGPDDLQPSEDGATIFYVARDGIVSATLEFDDRGRIAVLRCGPMKQDRLSRPPLLGRVFINPRCPPIRQQRHRFRNAHLAEATGCLR
ncbi:hypothetical protein ABIF72_002974 [Bradyrhizobium japonicum]